MKRNHKKFAELRAKMSPESKARAEAKTKKMLAEMLLDGSIQHITPAGGNIFADLGFEPEEAARLLAETDRIIDEKLASMKEYTFDLKFYLPSPDADPEQFVSALYEAGCDDAIVGLGQNGRIALSFTRKASSMQAALESAITDVMTAIPGAKLIEATPHEAPNHPD